MSDNYKVIRQTLSVESGEQLPSASAKNRPTQWFSLKKKEE